MSSSRMGRPPSSNPKDKAIPVRLDEATKDILQRYCDKHNVNRAEAIRAAIHRLEEDETNYFWTPEWRQELVENEECIKNGADEIQKTTQTLLRLIHEMKMKTGSEQNETDKE
ncbi:hypothetical protein GCM10010912_58450 [Paenibacillus albidus]|uniref:Ribbon-helix-helix protein CopG domain-containing protein n=1 Tax=Paenibacillus albidus TaxID=2041023 RepID=A0A917D215_9BACL|nr:ribbon-helix-helix protein, CopG family [Paenibacillus albidus]GGG06125.1 hypothetical protein GCM10010912_58450 [Paenibacillus albidus]